MNVTVGSLASGLGCKIDKLDASRLSGSASSRSCLRADASEEGISLGHLDGLVLRHLVLLSVELKVVWRREMP